MKANQLINPREVEEKAASRFKTILMLWFAISISLSFLLLLALLTPSSGKPNQFLTLFFLGIGCMVVIVSIFIKRNFIGKAIANHDAAALQSGYIVAFALSEAAALFALLDHFVTGSRYYYFGFAVAAIGMLLNFPKKDDVRATV